MLPLWSWLLGSPLKVAVWAGSRLAAWTSLLVIWRRLKGGPTRARQFLPWFVVINGLSLLALLGVFHVLGRRR